jgi:predicted dehydrogenase
MRKKVAIVGCGQLGSRHLQAIAKLGGPLKIQVVEPNSDNQRMSEMRLSEVLPEEHCVEVEWLNDLEDLDHESNLTIVSTTAGGRAEILTELAGRRHQRFLVEKMVCQSKEEYERLLAAFESRSVKGWVDCTRRYFPFYKRIMQLMENEKTIIFNATGGNHGLGCNAIHLLDLFWWMTGLSRELRLNGDYLSPTLLSNPRGDNLVEFSGTIVASTTKSSFASISFHPGNNSSVLVNITSDNYRVFVNEADEKALLARKENDWRWEEHEFQALYSSNLTTRIVRSIFEEDTCHLPTIQESFFLHEQLFRIFNQHIQRVTGSIGALCPIT